MKIQHSQVIGVIDGVARTLALSVMAALFFATPELVLAYQINGKVVKVADGDTITVRDGSENYRIRLASIDAPETGSGSKRPGQPYGEASRRFLANEVAGKQVELECFEEDRYGRHICDVLMGEITVNQLLVYAGLAWANRQGKDKYLRDRRLLTLQDDAKANKRGLWVEPNPVPPWVWRYDCWRQGQCGK
ncbi:thermonuclease family protein [Orrella daihaiensis]|nr:thermonuclease family protein [Orrella daihaiensis]